MSLTPTHHLIYSNIRWPYLHPALFIETRINYHMNIAKMLTHISLVIAVVVQHSASAAFCPSFFSTNSYHPSQLSYANSNDGENVHIPRRALPHIDTTSNIEAAIRAGYVIRKQQLNDKSDTNITSRQVVSRIGGSRQLEDNQINTSENRHMSNRGGVRPLRTIRRIVHGSDSCEQGSQEIENRIQATDTTNPTDIRVVKRQKRSSRLSLSNHPQLDEFLDKPEQLSPNEEDRKGARRVTFKATRESTKSILSKPIATLKEYMTQPVSQYSLLSFHDNNNGDSKQRRWLVRRLTNEESQRYMSSCSYYDDSDTAVEESNLFRLAVPLLPLIGWDLTPVIDLEVTVAANLNDEYRNSEVVDETCDLDAELQPSSKNKWAPLRGIRKRMRQRGDDTTNDADSMAGEYKPSVVKIRSLRVSLLSTQAEVSQVMSNNDNKANQNNRRGNTMQKEAIDMVSKVEEWLRPHITFEAELSWKDHIVSGAATAVENENEVSSVTVKSTAITSLTIPRIPSDVLRKAVPSAFFVKRLGATLTSQALSICLPRFLRQLEKDYNRWSGLELGDQKRGDVS